MEVGEFKRILELGLGRAISFLQTNEAAPYRDVILNACLHDTRYDGQVEDRRGTYLYDAITATGFQEFFHEPILQALSNAPDPNTYDALQLHELATQLAEQGDPEARQLVYDHFAAHLTRDDWGDVSRAQNLITLDAVDGFLFAVEQFGKRLPACSEHEPPYWFPPSEKDWDTDDHAYWNAAIQRATDNPHLAAYVAFEHERRMRPIARTRRVRPLSTLTYDQLRRTMVSDIREYGLEMWGQQAGEADLERAAIDLLTLHEKDDAVLLRKYLRIFWKRRFPLDAQRLIDLASQARTRPPTYNEDHTYAPHSRLVLAALNALGNIRHPAVRQLAFELIEGRQWIGHTAILLKSNLQDSDWSMFATLTREIVAPFEYHGLGMDIEEIFDAHPVPDAAQTLINLYEYGPCSRCRMRFVEALESIQAMPDWMRDECRYDANLDLREWVRVK